MENSKQITMKQVHILKCLKPYFHYKFNGLKDWEIRKDDRDYRVGDIIIEQEGEIRDGEFFRTGVEIIEKITYILRNAPEFGLKEGYCIMSTKIIDGGKKN